MELFFVFLPLLRRWIRKNSEDHERLNSGEPSCKH